MEKIAKNSAFIGMVILALLAVCFSAYGLFQSTGMYSTYKFQQGYQQCLVDVNNQIAKQQQEASKSKDSTNEK